MTSYHKDKIKFLKDRGWTLERYAKGGHQIWVYEPTGATQMVSVSSGATWYIKAFRREVEKKEQST